MEDVQLLEQLLFVGRRIGLGSGLSFEEQPLEFGVTTEGALGGLLESHETFPVLGQSGLELRIGGVIGGQV